MAAFYSVRVMLRKTLVNCWSTNLRSYGRTGIQLAILRGSSSGTKMRHRPVVIEEESDSRRFDSVFPQMLSCVTRSNDEQLRPAMDHLKSVVEYTVLHGHKKRGLLTVAAYRLLANQPTEEHLLKACIMGWCVEMLHASGLIADDIADSSITRYGRPCWHQLENVGLSSAVGDILMVENGAYKLLKTFFGEEHYYKSVVDLFHDVTLRTAIGQAMDNWSSQRNTDFDQFNQDMYDTICRYKGALYRYYFPLALAMHMVTIPDKEVLEETQKICVQLGQLFQAKNDYKDCFGDPNVTGKTGTDIEEGKCTWLIVTALKLVNEEERNHLKKCYGKKDPKLTKVVYDKYVELKLDDLFTKYKQKTRDTIESAIQQLPPVFPINALYYCLDDTN